MRVKDQYEKNYMMSVYRMRHNTNELLLVVPFILGLAYLMFGIPVAVAIFEIPFVEGLFIFAVPVILIYAFYAIRLKIIYGGFIKVKDVADKVDITEIESCELPGLSGGDVLIFTYSELMVQVLYNWFSSMGAVDEGKLHLYKVHYDNYGPVNIAVREEDLLITDDNRAQYKKETRDCIHFSDMSGSKVVNVKLYSRITQEDSEEDNLK